MIEMEGKVIDPKLEVINLGSSQAVSCPQLSAEFGIDDFDLPLPDLSTAVPK
jgi:hypothetical protein